MFIQSAHCFSFSISLSGKNFAGMTAKLTDLDFKKSTIYERGDKNNKSFDKKKTFPANEQNIGGNVLSQKLLSNMENTNRGRNRNKRCLKSRGCSGCKHIFFSVH